MAGDLTTGCSRLDAVLVKLARVRRAGAGYVARCPAHDDHEASLSIKLADDGKVLLRCFTGCSFETVQRALGIPMSELFAESPPPANGSGNGHGHARTQGVALAELAAHKRLPVEFLRSLGWYDEGGRVVIPYVRRDGSIHRLRYRVALSAKEGSRWGPGERQMAYEPDRGALREQERYVILVEGETDTVTLLYAGFPAIGVPGANATGVLELEHFEGVEHIVLLREPDAGGNQFVQGAKRRIIELKLIARVFELPMPAGCKDPSALYQRDPAGFAEAFSKLLEEAMRPRPEPHRSKPLVDLIECQVSDGVFFASGFMKLDEELDDHGLPTKSLTVIVGGPGSRKTGLGTHFADQLSRLGVAVMFMACDESRQSIVTRLGQRAGFSRSGLRDKGEIGQATRAGQKRYEAELGRVLHLVEIDDEEDPQTIEDAHEDLVRIAESRPRALIIDSLQTVRCGASDAMAQTAESLRVRTDAKVAVLKRIKRTGTIVVVISEVGRGFYNGSQKRIEKEHVLAAAKESGGVEFGVDLLMGLVRSKLDENQIELVIAKCRIGREPRFWLKWDRDRAKFDEIADPTTEAERVEQEASRRTELRQKVIETLLKRPGLSKTKLRIQTKAQRGVICDVVDELVLDGVLSEGPRHCYQVSPQHGGKHDGPE